MDRALLSIKCCIDMVFELSSLNEGACHALLYEDLHGGVILYLFFLYYLLQDIRT